MRETVSRKADVRERTARRNAARKTIRRKAAVSKFDLNKTEAVEQATPIPGTMRAPRAFFGMTSAVLSWLLLDQLGLLWLVPALRGRDSLIVIAALAGALIGITRARHVLHGATFLILGLWLAVCLTPLARRLAKPLRQESAPAPADAVVVLGSTIQPDNDFTDVALVRLLRGIELVRGHYAPRLVLTEIVSTSLSPAGSYRLAAENLLVRLRVECPIVTVGPVRDTHDEAVLVSRLARERGWRKILLVTSPTHSRRATLTFRRAGLEVVSTPCRETEYDLERMNRWTDRLQAFSSAMHEIVGLRVYRSRGWA